MQKKSFELTAKRLGNDVRFLKETASTNRDVDTAAQAGAAEGLLIMAETQTEGRGRMTRTWFSPGGANLYFSLLLRPDVELSSVPSLPLVVGLAVAEAIVACAPALLPKIKWPNDILVSGKKVCGMIENGEPLNREHLLAEILNRLEPLYDNWRVFGFKPLLQNINALDALRGLSVSMELAGAPLEGVASGIQADGSLLLQTAKGVIPVYSGEAHILSRDA